MWAVLLAVHSHIVIKGWISVKRKRLKRKMQPLKLRGYRKRRYYSADEPVGRLVSRGTRTAQRNICWMESSCEDSPVRALPPPLPSPRANFTGSAVESVPRVLFCLFGRVLRYISTRQHAHTHMHHAKSALYTPFQLTSWPGAESTRPKRCSKRAVQCMGIQGHAWHL